MSISPQQECVLKQIYEPVILRKLGLSENFPRAVLYSRKIALGVGLLVPRTIINMLAIKLYLRHQRAKDKTSVLIQIIKDNARVQYGYFKSIIKTDRIVKPTRITWSNKIQQKLSRRKIEIINRVYEPKQFFKNKVIIEIVVEYIRE